MSKVREIFQLFKEAFDEWNEDKAPRLAAALSYYTVFSLAPLLIVVIAVAGLFWGQEAVQGRLDEQIQGLVGRDGADMIQEIIVNARRPQESMVATILGLVTLLLGASGVFGQLQDALNTVWGVQPKPRNILGTIQDRFVSFTMVLGVGFLLLVSLVISAALAALNNFFLNLLPGAEFLLQVINFIISFGVITLLFALIFKILPDVEIEWRDVGIGAAFTAFMFTIGKTLIGLYLGNSGVASTFGAAGSLVIILLWIYYSAQILLYGAEFTQVYARRYGSHIRPADDAVALTREAQLQQGIPHTKWEGMDEHGEPVTESPLLPVMPQVAGSVAEPRRLPMDAVSTVGMPVNGDMEKRPVGGAVIGLGAALVSFAVGLIVGTRSGEKEAD
jgi:membrane protein